MTDLDDFRERWEIAAAVIDDDFRRLAPATQRRSVPSRSPRINEIRGAYHALHRTGMPPQISIKRLGYSADVARGYGDDKVLANLARAGHITILSDRMRHAAVVALKRPGMFR